MLRLRVWASELQIDLKLRVTGTKNQSEKWGHKRGTSPIWHDFPLSAPPRGSDLDILCRHFVISGCWSKKITVQFEHNWVILNAIKQSPLSNYLMTQPNELLKHPHHQHHITKSPLHVSQLFTQVCSSFSHICIFIYQSWSNWLEWLIECKIW